MPLYIDVGLIWLGVVPKPDAETDIEATYQAVLAPWWSIQPDLQLIIHPGGSRALPDATVLGMRTTITF